MKKLYIHITLLFIMFFTSSGVLSQVESSTLFLNRGKLWQSIAFGKTGPPFSNWRSLGIGLVWPGFDATLIRENIGGAPSYLVTGGMYVGCKWQQDSILTVDDWSIAASSIAEGAAAKYKVTKHRRKYPDGSNHWLQSNPLAGEEVIETEFEYNVDFDEEFQIKRTMPIRVRRTAHQWSGSKLDENYIIYEYVIKNISNELRPVIDPDRFLADTLLDFYVMFNYGIHCNSRAWDVLFPSLSPGARNTWLNYSRNRRAVFGRAGDYPETPGINEEFGLAQSMGPIVDGAPSGEYLAPAYAGFKLLYASPNKDGRESFVHQQGWSAGSNSIDLSGPFTNIGSLEARYDALKDMRLTANFVESSFDTVFMRRSRMWSMLSIGPYDIMPGDSIVFAIAEIVDGPDYADAINPGGVSANVINTTSRNNFNASADRAQATYDNGFDHADPPAAPEFSIDFNRESSDVAIVINWNDNAETFADPDDGELDLAGYIIYRSNYLPIGPWIVVDTVFKADPQYYADNEYTYEDRTVDIGQGYYYSITGYDSDGLETSIFANRTREPFIATLPPVEGLDEILVVPNPFVIGEGFSQPGAQDVIQFVNIPNPCTIRIYTVRGDLVKTIEVSEGTGAIVSWDQLTDFGQFIESGIYVFHVESNGKEKIGKFAVVR